MGHHAKLTCLATVGSAVVALCSGCLPTDVGLPNPEGTFLSLEVRPVAHYVGSMGPRTAERLVITSEPEWADAWRRLHEGQALIPDPPQVDFRQEIVIAVALGARSSSGYDVHVRSAYLRDNKLDVRVQETRPAPGCFTAPVMTYPVDIAAIAAAGATVVFEEMAPLGVEAMAT